MILLIDNQDTFVYSLARYVNLLGLKSTVIRHNELSLDVIQRLNPQAIILSPGPSTPQNSPINAACIKHFEQNIPILGICLGHQALNEAFGGITVKAPAPVHGRTSTISHTNHPMFKNVPQRFKAMRYHSLTAQLPILHTPTLQTIATSQDGLIMGLAHPERPLIGLQFHPESCLTSHGFQIMENFFDHAAIPITPHHEATTCTAFG